MFGELNNSGSTPALEAAMRFAAQRQRLIVHNIANIDTPNFINKDVSVQGFQATLREAIDRRRELNGGQSGPIDLSGNSEIQPANNASGDFTLNPESTRGGIMYHDRNNRDTERMMQDLVENATAFRIASDLLKGRYDLIKTAISERA